jgi:predicted RNA-binding Zn-ribbon protein involved in translation (DUF1610 family)
MKCRCGFDKKNTDWYGIKLDGMTNDFELNSYFPNYNPSNKRNISVRNTILFSCPRCGLIYNCDNEQNQ